MYVEYNDSLITGNDMIDTQHRELTDRMNKLVESCDENNSKSVAMKTLDFLSDYMNFNFSAEEQLQKEIAYPEYDRHKVEHTAFKQTIKDLEQLLEDEDGLSGEFTSRVQEQVVEWFYSHIKKFDKPFADFAFSKEK